MTEESIADLVWNCLEEFNVLEQVESHLVTDSDRKSVLEIAGEEARFKIWSGNIGAHSMGRRSLQYRLRDASHLQKQVKSLLKELYELLADAYAIVTGEKVPWDRIEDDKLSMGSDSESESDDVPTTEMGQVAQNVSDVINCLLRLSVAIRNPAPHDRFTTFISIDNSHYEPFDVQHVKSKFSKIEPWLADRLGQAISRKRQYFKYRESHHLKLSQELEIPGPNDAESTVASSLPQCAKAPGFKTELVDEDGASDSGITQTSLASSYAGSNKLRVPPLPNGAENGPFECPFCYMMIIATNLLSWKRHVFADLRPYICLSKNCTASEMEFVRRREWMLHEVQNHWRIYPCPCACGAVFPAKTLCQQHVIQSHSDAFPKYQVNSMIDLSSKSINVENGILCPLCKEHLHSAKEYRRHAGRHQEQLALFALPSIGTGDDDAQLEDDISETHSNASSDAQRGESAMEDEHGSFTKPDLDQDETASYASDRSQSKRHSVRPTSGDAVLVAYLDNGRDPELARAAGRESLPCDEESPDEDAPDRSVNSDLISGPLLQHLAVDALQAASLATVPQTIPDISTPTGETDYNQNSSVVEGNDDVQAQFKAPEGPHADGSIRRFDEGFYGKR